MPVPRDSPVKPHTEALGILDEILEGGLMKRGVQTPPATPARPLRPEQDGTPVFTAETRIVSLNVTAHDRDGHPAIGLQPSDFEVLEDGLPQDLASAASGEVPFNLALLLDLSATTLDRRELIQDAVRKFIGIARPQDRVAVYTLAECFFHVGSWLTPDFERAQESAGTAVYPTRFAPLYDTIVLGSAEELIGRPLERNALIIVSTGLDDQIKRGGTRGGVPSVVSFDRLRRAATEMPMLLYPVLLNYYGQSANVISTARQRMQDLADASGGRLFPARSVSDLAPVYAQVADELRAVYSLAYYPKNQNFDGKWRRIQVRVKRTGVVLRTRNGYYAR
jgi:Ca-activated chloride channel family protein